ncbi:MAG: response regulator [Desulfobacteraceae bacterium]|nr:MAG: response regulator [Desulfobacteraceae bacterium]
MSDKLRVLVLDDEESIRYSLRRFLKDSGFVVTTASRSEEAKALVLEKEFEAAVVDRILSDGQDGMDFVRYLKERQPDCESIVISAFPSFESAKEPLICQTFAYVPKPFRKSEICRVVQEAARQGATNKERKNSEDRSSETTVTPRNERDLPSVAGKVEQRRAIEERAEVVDTMGAAAQVLESANRGVADKEGKYLTFTLAKEDFGIGILKIKEIIGMMPITKVPRCPEFVRGVINLRGRVIPVLDLRMRFGVNAAEYTERTCIVVVEVDSGSGNLMVGLIVDSVSEVLNIKAEEIEETPAFGAKVDTDYILGMAKISGGVKILLNIDSALNVEDIARLKAL